MKLNQLANLKIPLGVVGFLSLAFALWSFPAFAKTSCPVTDPTPRDTSQQMEIGGYAPVKLVGDRLYRAHWPPDQSDIPSKFYKKHNPEMVVAYFKFSGEPNPKVKSGTKNPLGEVIDVPIYEKLESFSIKFATERYGPNCKLFAPVSKFPYLRNVDPSSMGFTMQSDPNRIKSYGELLIERMPIDYSNDLLFEVSVDFGATEDYGRCADLDPASGKPTYPLAGKFTINFEETEPKYRFYPDCKAKRVEKYGAQKNMAWIKPLQISLR